MILSDRSLRQAIEEGRLIIEPLAGDAIQPSSIDLRLGDGFRVFANHRYPHIDVRQPMEGLTELVETSDEEPFILHPGEFVLATTLERVGLPEDLVARLEGKALALDTRVPTPDGWRTLGDLQVGDHVFGIDGAPTTVVAATDMLHDRPCYAVVLSDGQTFIADAAHQWWTTTKCSRRRRAAPGVRTTEAIADSLLVGTERNHQIPLAAPLQYPEQDLLVDPYVLGIWLGDGTRTKGEITTRDPFVIEELRRAGYPAWRASGPYAWRIGDRGRGGHHDHRRNLGTGRFEADGSLQSELRALGVLDDKHVPEPYLRGSVAQRAAILAGLMDSDGYCDEIGRCEFVNTEERLADAVLELAASLGFRPVKRKKIATLNGIEIGPAYQVKFTPDRPVFRLPRKLARQKTSGRFHRFRAVHAVDRVASVPVRCIQVADPRGLFLIGDSVATHNSSLGRLGLLIHSTAGFIDAGWNGHLTLELSNVANLPITLYPGMKIGQLALFRLDQPAEHPYGSDEVGSKYQGQQGPTASRYHLNFEAEGS